MSPEDDRFIALLCAIPATGVIIFTFYAIINTPLPPP